jgi:hypothetical protein
MNDDAAALRELLMSAPGSGATRIVALVGSLSLVAVVLLLVRRRKLREEYTPIWIAVAVAIAVVGMDIDILRGFARLIGAWTLSSTVFFLGELFLVAICLNYAVRLSQASLRQKNLAQEVALLRARVEEVERGPAQARGA